MKHPLWTVVAYATFLGRRSQTSVKIQKDKKRVYMIFRYHLSFKLLINAAVVIFFVKSGTGSYGYKLKYCFVNFYILRYDFDFFFYYDHPDSQNWGVSANFKSYMNYWFRDSSRIYFWKWVSRRSQWHKSTSWTWRLILSKPLHFGHSVVVPNHIFYCF